MRTNAASLFVTLGLAALSCSFPDVDILLSQGSPSGSSSSASSSSSSSQGATGGSGSSTGGIGGGGGRGGNGGSGGAPSTTTAGGAAGGGGESCEGYGGSGGGNLCDKDGDGHLAQGEPCCGDDCDDDDDQVFGGQPLFFAVPSKHRAFDYDCDGKEKPDPNLLFNKTGNVACASLLCINNVEGYTLDVECGETNMTYWFKCNVLCQLTNPAPPGPLKCH